MVSDKIRTSVYGAKMKTQKNRDSVDLSQDLEFWIIDLRFLNLRLAGLVFRISDAPEAVRFRIDRTINK